MSKKETARLGSAPVGFEYYLSDETIERYRKKPLELRLEWLYAGNLFRKEYEQDIIEKQEKLRKGKCELPRVHVVPPRSRQTGATRKWNTRQ